MEVWEIYCIGTSSLPLGITIGNFDDLGLTGDDNGGDKQ